MAARLLILFSVLVIPLALWSQDAPPAFSAVSIKPGRSDAAYSVRADAKRWIATAVTTKVLLRTAFFKDGYQIMGTPSWTDSEPFDLELTTDAPLVPAQFPAMMQAMMADRFKLISHTENRELPGLALTLAKNGPKFGEHLVKRTLGECQSAAQKARDEGRPAAQCGGVRNGFAGGRSQLFAYAIPISQLCRALSNILQMPVWDDTGLEGTFDIAIEWAPDSDSDPSISPALQEQLGIKPESARRKTEVIVIDHIEKPSPN